MVHSQNERMIVVNSILLTDWHPLDHRPAPEYIPPAWDGPHVGKRLVEGLRTLMLMPMPRGPRASGSHWPAYAHDWADLLAQQEADAEQKQRDQREANRARLRPSSVEIMRMEQAIVWPARYLREFPQLLRTVQAVAAGRARDRDMEHAARRLRLPGRVVRRWNGEGLDLIARGLVGDRVRIFQCAG
jgi:hypothetical protein